MNQLKRLSAEVEKRVERVPAPAVDRKVETKRHVGPEGPKTVSMAEEQNKVFKSEFHKEAGKDDKHPLAAAYEEHQEKQKLAKQLGSGVDEGTWNKAKDASQEAFGKIKWPFVQWWYQHHGGR